MSTVPNSRSDPSTDPLRVESGETVLVLSPGMDGAMDEACGALLGGGEPDATDYLAVSMSQGPEARLQHWRQHVAAELPAKTGVVCTGDLARRSTAATDGGNPVRFPGQNVQVVSVSTPGDLTGLGMRISDCLSAWADDGNRVVVCVDSLTTLLQYVDTSRAFQFLHMLLARFAAADAAAHVHMDPNAHDEQTVATLGSLFDVVVRRLDDGWVVD